MEVTLQLTVDRILATIDIAAKDRGYARAFMATLLESVPPDVQIMAIPVAARLMAQPNWRKRMSVEAVREFCMVRRMIIAALRVYDVTETFDPLTEFFAGASITLANQLGLPH